MRFLKLKFNFIVLFRATRITVVNAASSLKHSIVEKNPEKKIKPSFDKLLYYLKSCANIIRKKQKRDFSFVVFGFFLHFYCFQNQLIL